MKDQSKPKMLLGFPVVYVDETGVHRRLRLVKREPIKLGDFDSYIEYKLVKKTNTEGTLLL